MVLGVGYPEEEEALGERGMVMVAGDLDLDLRGALKPPPPPPLLPDAVAW